MTNMYKQSKAILESDAERRNAEEGTKTEVPKSQEVSFVILMSTIVTHRDIPNCQLSTFIKVRGTKSDARGAESLRGMQPRGPLAEGHPWQHRRRAARGRGYQEGPPLDASQRASSLPGMGTVIVVELSHIHPILFEMLTDLTDSLLNVN